MSDILLKEATFDELLNEMHVRKVSYACVYSPNTNSVHPETVTRFSCHCDPIRFMGMVHTLDLDVADDVRYGGADLLNGGYVGSEADLDDE